MPGIAGIFSLNPQATQTRDSMLRSMTREPSSSSGSHSDPALGIHVGWVGSPGAAWSGRAEWSEDGAVCLVYSGEVWIGDGGSTPGRPVGPSAPATLLQSYERLGEGFFDRLNGCFSGLLLDTRRKRSYLFNDRYGLGRIYVARNGSDIHFSTDVAAILAIDPATRRFDPRSVAEFFSIGCPLNYRTLYAGIEQLPASSVCTYLPDGTWQPSRYFDPNRWEEQEPLSAQAFQQELTSTFASLLPEYLGPAGTSAMSLTGGLDGRMIMAWAHAAPGTFPCYSFASLYRDCEDVRVASRVAAAARQPFQTFVVGTEFLNSFPDLAAKAVRVSGGAMDVTGASELYVNRLARAISNVRITGNYGSEIVRGGVAFRPRRMAEELCSPLLRAAIRQAEATYAEERKVPDLTFIAFKQVPWHHHSRLSVERSQLTVRSPFLDDRIVRLMYRAPANMISSKRPSLELIHAGSPKLAAIPTDRGLGYQPLGPLEALRHRWLEFTFRAEYAYDYGMPQWLTKMDSALSPLGLERLFLGRHKFQHYRTWYRRPLSNFVREMLHSPSTPMLEFFDRGSLKRMADEHIDGAANYTVEIHRAMTLELVCRQLLSGS